MARSSRSEDTALTELIREAQGKIFAEYLEMFEQQQRNLLAWPERSLLKLDSSVSEVLEDAGVCVPLACEQGICGTCFTGVTMASRNTWRVS